MRLEAGLPEVRDWRDVADGVDAAVRGAGLVGREPPSRFSEVAPLLTPPQQLQWLTDAFVGAASWQGPLSSWKGVFAPEDTLARERLAAIMVAGEAFAPELSALVRWTLAIPSQAPEGRVIPTLWFAASKGLREFFIALVHRWPEGLSLEQLPSAGPPPRERRPAASGPVRFPHARWAPVLGEGEETLSRGQALAQALLALWRAGAEDAELARFHAEFLREWGHEADTLARWVTVEDPDARLDVLRVRVHPARPFRLEAQPVRTYASVRARIDELLGDGRCSVDEAARRLAPVERVTWVLDELFAAMCQETFHLWDQNWVGRDFDGTGLVVRIAAAAREVEPLASDLFQWTARWARERGIAMVSAVPDVWREELKAGEAFIHTVAERWPEDLEPHLLPEPPRWSRPELAPSEGPVRYPGLAVGFTPRGAACPVQVAEKDSAQRMGTRVMFALWSAGASDAELAAFSQEYPGSEHQEPEVLSRWILFDGDGGDAERREALRARLHPQHPIAKWMGVPKFPWPLFLIVEDEDLDVLQPHLSHPEHERLRPHPEYSLTQRLRGMLRTDPDWLMVSARDFDADSAQMLITACLTGHSIIVGDGPGVERLREAFLEFPVRWEDQVQDYRRGQGRRPA